MRQIVAKDDELEVLVELWEGGVRVSTRPVGGAGALRVWSSPLEIVHDDAEQTEVSALKEKQLERARRALSRLPKDGGPEDRWKHIPRRV